MRTVEQIKAESAELLNLLRSNYKQDEADQIVKKLNELEAEKKQVQRIELLAQVNMKFARIREMAAKVWECEQPTEDITNNDGTLHKVKSRKYPILSSIPYLYVSFKDGVLLDITSSGEKFRMYHIKYESGKQNEYTRPSSFDEFLELNTIPVKDISIEQYEQFTTKLIEANKKLDEAVNEYSKTISELNVFGYSYWDLVSQHGKHVNEYLPR